MPDFWSSVPRMPRILWMRTPWSGNISVSSSRSAIPQADTHLEYARLYLAQGEHQRAREHLDTASAMVTRMGYHRRDAEVAELHQQLVRS